MDKEWLSFLIYSGLRGLSEKISYVNEKGSGISTCIWQSFDRTALNFKSLVLLLMFSTQRQIRGCLYIPVYLISIQVIKNKKEKAQLTSCAYEIIFYLDATKP